MATSIHGGTKRLREKGREGKREKDFGEAKCLSGNSPHSLQYF
jgi:hypothetical protein